MATSTVREVFQKVSALTLEDWAMMLIDDEEPTLEDFKGHKLFLGSANYEGVVTATLGVLCTEEFCKALYQSVLGEFEEIDSESCKDALAEMVNVFLGNFLTEAYGPETVFKLDTPGVVDTDEDSLESFFQNRFVFSFVADDEPVAIAIMKS